MHRSAPLRVVGFVRAADAVAARAGDKRIDAAEACGDARQEAGPVGGARGVAGQREAARFGSQRVERRLAAPDQHDAVAAAGEAARAGGADAGAGAGNGDRAGGAGASCRSPERGRSGHFRRRRRAPVSAERMNAGRPNGRAWRARWPWPILQRLTMSDAESLYPPHFCDKPRKPGKIARAGAQRRAARRPPIPSYEWRGRQGRGRQWRGRPDRRERASDAQVSRLPTERVATAYRPVARWRDRTIDKRTGRGRQ